MNNSVYITLVSITMLAGVIPLLTALARKKPVSLKLGIMPFVWLVFIAALYEFIGTVLLAIDVTVWFKLYALTEYLTLFYYFGTLILFRKYRVLAAVSLAGFLVLYTASLSILVFPAQLYAFIGLMKAYSTVFIIMASTLWITGLFREMAVENLWKDADFYFVAALFIFHATTFFIFILAHYIHNSTLYLADFWLTNIIATLIFRLFLSVGIWKMQPN